MNTRNHSMPSHAKPRWSGQAPAVAVMAVLCFGAAQPARANTGGEMAVFYLSLKGIQVAALSGAADMWKALGSAEKAQECLGLASDLDKGDLANEDGMKKFKAKTAELSQTIGELSEAGLPLSREQQASAQKGALKLAGTTVLWAGVAISAVRIAKDGNLNMLEKIVIGVIMAGEVKSAADATGNLLSAWKAYRSMTAAGALKEPSKELAAQFAAL